MNPCFGQYLVSRMLEGTNLPVNQYTAMPRIFLETSYLIPCSHSSIHRWHSPLLSLPTFSHPDKLKRKSCRVADEDLFR